MGRRAVGVGLGVLAMASGLHACKSLQVAHSGDDPVFELVGKHLSTPCEACHGPGRPEAQSRLCIDCHAENVPDAAHFPGQECGACHTPLGWEVVDTPPDTGTPPDTTPTGDTGTIHTPGWVHEAVAPDELCWDCHAEERPVEHWWNTDITYRWDCGPCHTLATWGDDPRTEALDPAETTYVHPARTPHGTRDGFNPTPSTDWVVACDTCHTNNVLTGFDCVNCHLERNSGFFPHYNASNEDCLGCHKDGDFVLIDPP